MAEDVATPVEDTSSTKIAIFAEALHAVVDFSMSEEFQTVLEEMWELPPELRHEFVELVLLSSDELSRRGVAIPSGIEIQRSWFEDERPTLFCITKRLPPGMGWKIATVTVDNPSEYVSQLGWRPTSTTHIHQETSSSFPVGRT